MNIWELERGMFSVAIIKERLSNHSIRLFASWLEMEAAWRTETRPEAIVMELAIPEPHPVLAHLLLSYYGWFYGFPFVFGLKWVLRVLWYFLTTKPFPNYLFTLWPSNLVDRGYDFDSWGGLLFMRQRALRKDQGQVKIYIYAQAANTEYWKLDADYGPTCAYIMSHVQTLRSVDFKSFAKGYRVGPPWQPLTIVGDEHEKLAEQIRRDFPD